MAGQKKNLRCSEETPGFPDYYIGWIEIGKRHLINSLHKISNKYLLGFDE